MRVKLAAGTHEVYEDECGETSGLFCGHVKVRPHGKFQNNLICVWDIDRSESENESYGVNRKYKH